MGLSLSSAVFAYHEATHGALIRNRRLNTLLGSFWAGTVLTSYASYLHSHREHHRRTNVPGDPQEFKEFTSVLQYGLFTLFASTVYTLILLFRSAGTVVGRGPTYMRRHRRAVGYDLLRTAALITGAVVLTVAFPTAMLAFYWVPFLIQGMVVTPLVNIPEHYGLPRGQLSALVTTRTTTTVSVLRFFVWHNNFHAEHHMHPGIPSHNLARVHQQLGDRVITEQSYLRWHLALLRSLARSAAVGADLAPVRGGPVVGERGTSPGTASDDAVGGEPRQLVVR
jgi:fatty acid desaturase